MYKILTIILVVYFFISLTTPFSVIWLSNYYLKPEIFLNSLTSLLVVLILMWLPNDKKTTFKSIGTPIFILFVIVSNLLLNGLLKDQFYNLIYIASIVFVFTIIRNRISENTGLNIETPIIFFFILISMVHIVTPFLFRYSKHFFNPRLFDNYGQYSNYIALFFPFFVSIFFLKKVESKFDQIVRTVSCILSVSILLILFYNNIRTAWIPCVLFLFFCYFRNTIFAILGKYRAFETGKKYKLVILTILIFFTVFLFSYYLKKDSADGRLFIWHISWKIFLDYPWTGVGFNHFQSYYNIYQANYFKLYEDPKNAWLASDVFFAFNEILQSLVECGVFALLLWGVLFYEVKKKLIKIFLNWHNNPSKQWLYAGFLGFLSLLAFQIFFSYPFKDQSSTHTIFIINLFYSISFLSK